MSLHTAQLALNPLLLYYCNETTGSTANDTSGNANGPTNLTIGTGVSKNSSKLVPSDTVGGSFYMNSATVVSTNAVIRTGTLPSYLTAPIYNATVDCVAQNITTSTWSVTFGIGSTGTTEQDQLAIGNITTTTMGGSVIYTTDGVTPQYYQLNSAVGNVGGARYLTMVFANGGTATPTLTLYINGSQVAQGTLTSGAYLLWSTGTNGPGIFNNASLNDANYLGRISNCGYYGTNLSGTQVGQLYSAFLSSGQQSPLNSTRFWGGFQNFNSFNART